MTKDADHPGRRRWRLLLQVVTVVVGAGVLAVAAVGGVRLHQDVDELEGQLAATVRQLTAAQSKLDDVEKVVGDVAGASSRSDVDGLTASVGAVRSDQQSLTATVRSLARDLEAVRSDADEMSEFLGDTRLFASQVDLGVLEGCMGWIVDQIVQMANGYEPGFLPPNDCRLVR